MTTQVIQTGGSIRVIVEDDTDGGGGGDAIARGASLDLVDFGFRPFKPGDDRVALASANRDALLNALATAKAQGAPGLLFPEGVCPYTDRGLIPGENSATGTCFWLDGYPDFTLFVDDCKMERLVRDTVIYGVHGDFSFSNGNYAVIGGTFRHFDPISIPVTVQAIFADRFVVTTDDVGASIPALIDNILLISNDKRRILAANIIREGDYEVMQSDPDPDDTGTGNNGDGTWSIYCTTATVLRPDKYLYGTVQAGDKLSLTPKKRGGSLSTAWNCGLKWDGFLVQECGNTCFSNRSVRDLTLNGTLNPRRGYLSTVGGFANMRNCTGTFTSNTELNWINADGYNVHTIAFTVTAASGNTVSVVCNDTTAYSNTPAVPEIGSDIVFLSGTGAGSKEAAVREFVKTGTSGSLGVYQLTLSSEVPDDFDAATWSVYNQQQAAAVRINSRIRVGAARGAILASNDVIMTLETDRLVAGSIMSGYPTSGQHPELCGFRGGHTITLNSKDCCRFFRNQYFSSDVAMQWSQYGGDGSNFGLPALDDSLVAPITINGESDRSGLGGVRFVGLNKINGDLKVTGAGELREFVSGLNPNSPPANDIYLNGVTDPSGSIRTDNPASIIVIASGRQLLGEALTGIVYPTRRANLGTVTSTVTIDMDTLDTASLTLGANIVLNAIGSPGSSTLVTIRQDATGGRTISPGDNFIDPVWTASGDPGSVDFLNLYAEVEGVYSGYDAEVPA